MSDPKIEFTEKKCNSLWEQMAHKLKLKPDGRHSQSKRSSGRLRRDARRSPLRNPLLLIVLLLSAGRALPGVNCDRKLPRLLQETESL
jgi:hypothetical protein